MYFGEIAYPWGVRRIIVTRHQLILNLVRLCHAVWIKVVFLSCYSGTLWQFSSARQKHDVWTGPQTDYNPVEELGDKLNIVLNPYFFTEQTYSIKHILSKIKDHKKCELLLSVEIKTSPLVAPVLWNSRGTVVRQDTMIYFTDPWVPWVILCRRTGVFTRVGNI